MDIISCYFFRGEYIGQLMFPAWPWGLSQPILSGGAVFLWFESYVLAEKVVFGDMCQILC